jgi:hypothetical protein
MIVVNGVKATKNDLRTLCKWLRLKKIKILFFKRGKNYINIITD